jgi:hypothetical protein
MSLYRVPTPPGKSLISWRKKFFLENPEMSWDFGQLILSSLNILEFNKCICF